MDLDSDHSSDFAQDEDESFQEYEPQAKGLTQQGAQVKDQPFDVAYEVNDSEDSMASGNSFSMANQQPGEAGMGQGFPMGGASKGMQMNPGGAFEEEEVEGGYNPDDYENLAVSAEVKELFRYITGFKPQRLELDVSLKPFIPEYIPSVGEVDAFLKIPRPDGQPELLGLTVLDEPSLNQSDRALLEIKLAPLLKRPGSSTTTSIHSIENADKNPKQITRWIQSISEVLRSKPPPTVNYSKPMKDIETLMDVWPHEVEEALAHLELPGPELDIDLASYVKIVCTLLDVPVHSLPNKRGMVESLHLVFSLYSEFKSNQHFQTAMKQDYAEQDVMTF
jgi:intraflagellar transport protein 46